uniref:Large ribosomal subunit protein uL14c n=1 Tax=Pterocladiophila hemisphaerica TaxID=2712948 RepID=A0A6M3WX71_9FLOR|nr:ribosomal protein L14 [Pterocladiophila hemisphaerica]
MIQVQTYLNIADNSGASTIMCINILGTHNPHYAKIGDKIIAVIKSISKKSSVKKSDIVKALVIRTRQKLIRSDGTIIHFPKNEAILLDKANNPQGTRIFGPITKEIHLKNFYKISSLAQEII